MTSAFQLTKTRFLEGVWEGVLHARSAGSVVPEIRVTLNDTPVQGVSITDIPAKDKGQAPHWLLQVPVPVEAVGEGVQTFLIYDASTDEVLSSFTMIAGEVLGDDLRAEVELLRAELDMLKRAFRRHCLETT